MYLRLRGFLDVIVEGRTGVNKAAKITTSTEQSPSRESASRLATQEIPEFCGTRTFIAGPCLEPGECSPQNPHHILEIRFNIILPSMCKSTEWALSTSFSNENCVRIFIIPVHATCSAHVLVTAYNTNAKHHIMHL